MAEPFGFEAVAAEHVLDLTLARRTEQGIQFLEQERDELRAHLGR